MIYTKDFNSQIGEYEGEYSDYSDDSDSDYEGILRKALDVTLPPDFVPKKHPENGTEFLQNVMYERRSMKLTSFITRDELFKDRPVPPPQGIAVFTIPNPPIDETGTFQLPTLEWQLKKLEDFKEFVNFVELNHKPQGKEKILISKNEHHFVSDVKSSNPKYTVFCNFSYQTKLKILEILTAYLSKQEIFEDFIGTWLLYILATLGYPPSPDCCHIVREFLRVCRIIRSKYCNTMPESSLKALNYFICISSRYYGQLDLADGYL